jgi:hypothetical protein
MSSVIFLLKRTALPTHPGLLNNKSVPRYKDMRKGAGGEASHIWFGCLCEMIVQGPVHGSPSPSLNTRKSMAALLLKQIFPNLRPDNSSVKGDIFEVVVHISSYRLYT